MTNNFLIYCLISMSLKITFLFLVYHAAENRVKIPSWCVAELTVSVDNVNSVISHAV